MPISPRLVDEYTFTDILNAYLDCRKRKRSTHTAIEFDLNSITNLEQLLIEINSGTYKIGPSRGFVVTFPKAREVWAAQYRDRIVHHLVCRDIAPFYQQRFIATNCACIKGRGTLYATNYLLKYCRSITQDWTVPAYYLQIDIKNFFVSLNKDILWSILVHDLGHEDSLTMRLLRQIVYNNPTHKAIVKHGTDFSIVPYHKSLWHCPAGHGMPIGDLPSQLCASGIYLDGLDKFVKHTLKCRYYVRYVDDAIILNKDPVQLEYWLKAIGCYLKEKRDLELSPNKCFIKPIKSGINFVGSYILPYRVYPRRMTIASAFKAAKSVRRYSLDPDAFSSVNSYLGLMRHLNSYNIRKKICKASLLPVFVETDKPKYTKIFSLI